MARLGKTHVIILIMKIVKVAEVNKIPASRSTTIFEYLMKDKNLSGAVAEIHGRYPEKGFAQNKLCKELVFVISGEGEIITEKGKLSFDIGDTILIDRNEKYYWLGNFSIFMATAPAFSAGQHKIIK